MNRIVAILLCICSAVVCAFLAWLGYQGPQSDSAATVDAKVYSCQQLLEKIPPDLGQLQLADYKSGKHYVSYDDDDDGKWDRVFVALFPSQMTQLKQNYRAVFVSMAGIADEQQLFEKINSGNLDADYWDWSQRLDNTTYNRMAEYYDSLDFDRSVILYSGYPRRTGVAQIMLWGGAAGVVLSIAVIAWQLFGSILDGMRRASNEDEDEDGDVMITNRAELPTTS